MADDGDGDSDDFAGRIQPAMHDAICAAVHQAEPGTVVVRWFAAVDVIEPDGERVLYGVAPEDLRRWEALGMLDFLRAREYADLTAEFVHGED